MEIPAILQGDSSGGVTIWLAQGHNYEGATLVVVFNGVSRQYTNLTAGGSVVLAFTADETAGMPLGTALVNMRLVGANGGVETVGNADARIKVTDCVAEVNAGGSFAVTPGGNPLADVEGLGTRYTGDQLRAKINEVIAKLGGTVAALLLCALPCLGGALDVQTAPFGTVYSDAPVVTNVSLDVHALTNGWKFSEPVDLSAASNYTDRALGAFASTGTVAHAATYGTPTRWMDATGCVWEVGFALGNPVSDTPGAVWENYEWWPDYDLGKAYMRLDGVAWEQYANLYDGWTNFTFTSEATRSDSAGGSLPNDITFFRRLEIPVTNLVGRVALTNDIPDVSGYATQQQATNAATAVADTKISTNNAAFVSAVLAVPLTGADAGDLAEIAEYGGYGTVGAALLALIAGLAALKRRMGTAETSLAQKANASDLPYRLVEPGEWEFSYGDDVLSIVSEEPVYGSTGHPNQWKLEVTLNNEGAELLDLYSDAPQNALVLELSASGHSVTATRPSPPGHLLDRAGNRVVVSGDTTLTLPAANPGYLRDFLVRLEISGSTVPTITFAAPTGETITYETDGDEFPVPDEAGTWSYSFTENCVAHKFAVSLKKVNVVAQGGS